MPETPDQRQAMLSSLVEAALSRRDLSVLRDMLLSVARQFDAQGCALWQVQPTGRWSRDRTRRFNIIEPDSKMFVLADGVTDGLVCAYHDVPANRATAVAMRTGRVTVPNIASDARVGMTGDFLLRAKIKSLHSVRVHLDDETLGALTVYRNYQGEFTEDEFNRLEFLASHIPSLYAAIRDRVGFQLIQDVERQIRESKLSAASAAEDLAPLMERLSKSVADSFQCIEASIYLENPFEPPGQLRLMSTTCPAFIRKDTYVPQDYGLTTWVWNRQEHLAIFDLSSFVPSDYPALIWKDEAHVEKATRDILGLPDDAATPPISFMAVPIQMDGRTYGVFRCCAARRGPYYFAEREVHLLDMIAAQIGQLLNNVQRQKSISDELNAWKVFNRGVSSLNVAMQQSLTGLANNQEEILGKALEVAREGIPAADVLSVSLYDAQTRRLTVAAHRGDAWQEGGEAAAQIRRYRLAASVDETRSPTVIAFRTKRFLDLPGERFVSPLFPGVRQGLFAPILSDSESLGVIAIHRTRSLEFPVHAPAMIQLLTQQIGLYLQLASGLRQLTLTYQDFQHQVRSPVFQAYKRMQRVKREESNYNLEAVKGLLGKAKRVATNLRLFANLHSGKPIQVSLAPWAFRDLTRSLIDAASDSQVLWLFRDLRFQVEEATFEQPVTIEIDFDLFGQAVANILDNAGKYSFRKTEIMIKAFPNSMGFVAIAVRNTGRRLSEAEAKLAPVRGWRGVEAERLTGEGSGIGLWIVDHIMGAHHGRLEVLPTNSDGETEIRLIFPVR